MKRREFLHAARERGGMASHRTGAAAAAADDRVSGHRHARCVDPITWPHFEALAARHALAAIYDRARRGRRPDQLWHQFRAGTSTGRHLVPLGDQATALAFQVAFGGELLPNTEPRRG
jgi:hypothetical protein